MSVIILLSYTLLGVLMFWVVFQDFKSRTLNLYVALGILGSSFFLAANLYSLKWIFEVMLYNLLLLTCFYGLLLLYFRLKNVSVSEVFETKLGLGDVVFTIAIIPCFTTKDLLMFLLLSFLFSIILFQLFNLFKKYKRSTIPLAGNMSVFFLLVQLLSKIGIEKPINPLI